jgi:hypothetical protein
MIRLPGTFGTRVARRILGLFLVCALFPVALVLVLSYAQVQRTVGDQHLSQLALSCSISAIEWVRKNSGSASFVVASLASAFTPFSQNSKRCRS